MVNHSKGKSKICKKGNIAHKKHLNTLNKKTNFSYNDLNRINQNDNARKKLVLNLSNINVIKKSASKLCLNLKKTNIKCPFLNKSENQNSKNSQNQIRKNHNALLTNLSSINKSSNKKGNKSSRNMIRNLKLKNNL